MNSTRLLMFLVLLVCVRISHAEDRAPLLQEVGYESLSGDRVDVRFEFSEELSDTPLVFSIDNPARIVLDFMGSTLSSDFEREQNVSAGVIDKLTAVEAGGRIRVLLGLSRALPYKVTTSGAFVILSVGTTADESEIAQQQAAASSEGEGVAASSEEEGDLVSPAADEVPSTNVARGVAGIADIDFHRGTRGEGRISIVLDNPTTRVDINKEGKKLVVDFYDIALSEVLDRRLDVIDFATPVSVIDTKPAPYGARMTIETTDAPSDYIVYQADEELTIEVTAISKKEAEELKKERVGYSGERLSLNFQNITVRAVLQLIADFTGFNMVVSDSVSGAVTLRLKNVPWDQALDVVLKTKGLAMRKDGNVVLVAPQEEIVAREQLELESGKQVSELEPLQLDFIPIDYAKAQDLADLIKSASSEKSATPAAAGSSGNTNSLLTSRGQVSVDVRTNTLIVRDVPDSLEAIRRLIQRLDVPVRQVLIESRIVYVEDTFIERLGVRWGYSDNTLARAVGGSRNQFGDIGGALPGVTTFNPNFTFNSAGADNTENFIVSLPASEPTTGLALAFGKIGTRLLQLELSANLLESRAEDIASPSVITANQQRATVKSGIQIPYQEASSSGATSVSFKEAVISLNVVPQITPDDRVLLDLKVNQDSQGSTQVNGVPTIQSRELTTRVFVDDGETVVLGGVYVTAGRDQSRRVPFLGDVPFLGALFRSIDNENNQRELLVFVTPKIEKDFATRGAF